jgi:hypothetical protein
MACSDASKRGHALAVWFSQERKAKEAIMDRDRAGQSDGISNPTRKAQFAIIK